LRRKHQAPLATQQQPIQSRAEEDFASLIKMKHQAVHVTTSDDFIQETANDRREKIL
jgi:hypothetical protein